MRTTYGIVGLALVFAACGDDGGRVSVDAGPRPDAPPNDVTTFDVVTSKGSFTIETHRSWAPNGVARFHELVELGFYNDVRFFRVISGFVAQFGINGTPATHAMWKDRTIQDDPVLESNKRGYLTFAQTSAPNSRTTQLFVNLVDNAFLDGMRFAPFAQVTEGLNVVDALNAEYGETPNQQSITTQGNAYLETNFPNLDYIVSVTAR